MDLLNSRNFKVAITQLFNVQPIGTKDKVVEHNILGKYCDCISIAVIMDLLNLKNFKVAITQLFNVQQVETLLCDSLSKIR